MKKIIKAYQYLFYKFYRFFEDMSFPWWSDTKATFVIDVLLFFMLLSLCINYKIFIDRYFDILALKYYVVILFIIVGLFNSWFFTTKNNYKSLVAEFDKLPKKKNRIGSWLVFLFVCLVIASFISSFYMFSQIDWSQYR